MPKYPAHTCPGCGQRFAPAHHRQLYCTTECQKAYNASRMKPALVDLALAWRGGKKLGKIAGLTKERRAELTEASTEAFTLLCRALDEIILADIEAGRQHPTVVYQKRQRAGLLDY